MDELSMMIRKEGSEVAVIERARLAFQDCPNRPLCIGFLGLCVEAHAYLDDPGAVMNGIRELDVFAQPPHLFAKAVVNALQSVGLAVAGRLGTHVEYQHAMWVVLQVSETRIAHVSNNPELTWYHHVLAARYYRHVGEDEKATFHVDAANQLPPVSETTLDLRDWNDLLVAAST